ncbi:MAG: T9SS type A sorting domain-containing protein [Chitinophagaceae bacterium]|nr:T9SS type A sorting domain-containing protein [Chitinophagaceae bacterium]
MKQLYLLACSLSSCLFSFSQISVTGTSSAAQVPNNAPAVAVDNAITLTAGANIPGFTVSVSSNFSSGDVLGYTGALPSGVTASYSSGTGILTFSGSTSAANYQVLLRTVTFNTTSSSTATRTITFRASDGVSSYYSANGHFYGYIPGSFSWTQAKADAAAKTLFGMQGYLVTVTNSAENTFVNSLSGKGWIGASDAYSEINAATGVATYVNQAASEGKWYWVTGPEKGTQFSNGSSVLTYANYAGGEPNNAGSLEHYLENSWASGSWNDSQVGGPLGYIIEYGGTGGDPSVDADHSRSLSMIATEVKTAATTTPYQLHAASVFVDNTLTITSTGNITNATVTISGGFKSGDVLSYTGSLPSGVAVSGSGYNSSTGVLSFTGTTSPNNWQMLLRTVKFNSTSSTLGNRTVTFSLGNLVANSNGHFYESITAGANWSTAKANAASRTYMGLTGYLATITSASENEFIKQKIGTDAWIGNSDAYTEINAATGVTTYANQTASEGKWYWVTGPEKGTQITIANASGSGTGTPFGTAYNNWNGGEPNNSSNEHYGEIYASGVNPGKWNDLNGSQSLAYVVEYGGLSTDPALTLTANKTIANNSFLPVTGLELNVQSSGKNVLIKWSTITEINCERFDVLHSTDGIVFNKIGSTVGAGTTDIKQYYQFVHDAPVNGNNYYRLQQFDIDGRFKYSPVREVTIGNPVNIIIGPNPAHSAITVNGAGNSDMQVFSLNGTLMYSSRVTSDNFKVNVEHFQKGTYVIRIRRENAISSLKFVKE